MDKKNVTIKLVTKFMGQLDKFKKSFFIILGVSLLSSGLAILYPVLFKELAVHFQKGDMLPLVLLVLVYASIQVVQNTLQSTNALLRRKYALTANKKVIHGFYDKVQSLPLKRFKRFQHNGEIYQRVIDSLQLNQMVVDVTTGLIIIFINLVIYISILTYVHWVIGVAIFMTIPFYYLLNRLFSAKIQYYQEMSLLNNSPLTSHLFDCLNRIVTIKALGAKDRVMRETQQLVDANAEHQINLVRYSTKVSWVNQTVSQVFILAIISLAAFLVLKGHIAISSGLVVLALIQQVFSPLQSAFDLLVEMNRAYVILNRYYSVLDEKSEHENQKGVEALDLNSACSVEFRNISFAYNSNMPVVENLNLSIPAGKRVAFVGRTGVGKSTLMNLILGLYKAQKGDVLIHGKNIDELDLSYYRKQLGVVLQNEYIFPGTVFENATFGLDRDVSGDEVIEALKNACLWPTIEKMENGIYSRIKDETLSGGEKQRLTIARAFLRDPQLILFDEPTSALDMDTEAQIQKAMDRLLAGRTSITIAHRLSTIKKCDIIFVIKDGTVSEKGTHEELVRNAGYYAKLYDQSIVA